jgi:hypothetical protein
MNRAMKFSGIRKWVKGAIVVAGYKKRLPFQSLSNKDLDTFNGIARVKKFGSKLHIDYLFRDYHQY